MRVRLEYPLPSRWEGREKVKVLDPSGSFEEFSSATGSPTIPSYLLIVLIHACSADATPKQRIASKRLQYLKVKKEIV